jgi:hypothetical protein
MAFAPTTESESPARIEKPDLSYGQGDVETPMGLATDPRWLSVQRLVNTESFAKASRLSSFLLYVVERFLQGRTDEITEQQIGVHVFGRPADYNPGEDNIVRQTARQLRQRLALYYQEEGRNEQIQVVVPRGGYIPQFADTSDPAAPPELVLAEPIIESAPVEEAEKLREEAASANPVASGQRRQNVRSAMLIVFGVLLGVALTLLVGAARARLLRPPTETDKLWNVLFSPTRRTMVVVGDAGVNMYSNLSRTQVDAWEYGAGSYLSRPEAQTPSGFTWSPFAARRYTTTADLMFVSTLLQLPNINQSRIDVRFARDITAQDLKESNAILIGSSAYDPWVQIFDKSQNFRMAYDGTENSISIYNRHPIKGEQASYKWSETDPQRTGYALISLTDNLDSTGKVLLVQGTTMGGINAAMDLLFHPEQMDPLIHDAIGKNGKPSNFELLLETTFYWGGNMKAKVLAERIHSPS